VGAGGSVGAGAGGSVGAGASVGSGAGASVGSGAGASVVAAGCDAQALRSMEAIIRKLRITMMYLRFIRFSSDWFLVDRLRKGLFTKRLVSGSIYTSFGCHPPACLATGNGLIKNCNPLYNMNTRCQPLWFENSTAEYGRVDLNCAFFPDSG
jgi:hypothetical protein